MAKSVFTAQIQSSYDDDKGTRYHFPSKYLPQVQRSLHDFVVYYEPGRGGQKLGRIGRSAYIAVARIDRIEKDDQRAGHYYAWVSDYLDFTRAVPFREGKSTYESRLAKADGSANKGLFGWSVRELADHEFETIVSAGFGNLPSLGDQPRESAAADSLQEEIEPFERPIVETLVRRPFRDAAFALNVKRAYGNRCLLTGLQLINGGGHAEIDAAHIRPVGSDHKGPDSVRNGLALSKTAHWLFDRGLASLTDDYELLLATDELPSDALRLFAPDVEGRLPTDPLCRPFRDYLAYHREKICEARGHHLKRF